MDALAVSYAGAHTLWHRDLDRRSRLLHQGNEHLAKSGRAADEKIAAECEAVYHGLIEQVSQRLAALAPPDADVSAVAAAIVEIVDMPHGKRPFRRHIDPADDGSEVVSAVADRIRVEFLTRVGLEDILHPHSDLTVN